MRIVLIGPTYPFRGGIAHHTTLLANELAKEHTLKFISFTRQYPKILFPGKSDKDPSREPFKTDSVEYIIDSLNPHTLFQAGEAISKFRPDLVIFPWWVVFWAFHFRLLCLLIKKHTAAQIVFLCHNVIEHESNWLKKWITKFALNGADRFLTQSEVETRRIKQLMGTETSVKTTFHPTYVDLTIRDTISVNGAKKILGVSNQVLLFFGFVRPYKGLDTLLRAMPDILRKRDVTLVIAGEFWNDREEYLKTIKELNLSDHIQIHDKYIVNEEVPIFFTAADLVVQPYKNVTGSGVLQLSYGFEVPVVATDIGSLAEIIDDGKNGRLVQSNSPTALSHAIIESLEEKNLLILKRNAKLVKAKFSWQKFTDVLCDEHI